MILSDSTELDQKLGECILQWNPSIGLLWTSLGQLVIHLSICIVETTDSVLVSLF